MMSALTLWTEANNLVIRYDSVIISNKSTQLWRIVHQEYFNLKYLAKMINNVIGSNITSFLITFILEYAISLDELILMGHTTHKSHWIRWVVVGFYFCSSVAILLVSGDICRQVCTNCLLRASPWSEAENC